MTGGFTFFHSFYEAAQELEAEDRLQFYDAIINYSINGEESEITGIAKAMFVLVKPVLEKSREKSKAGKKGGEASCKQTRSKREANVKQNGSDISEDKDKEIEKDKEYITPHTPKGGGTGASVVKKRFDQFWSKYPNKTGKGAAEKSWNKISPGAALFSQILSALEKAIRCEQWTRENGRYIPNPATWLNQRRWEDEYALPEKVDTPVNTSFDTDDFFAAALRQSYGETKKE